MTSTAATEGGVAILVDVSWRDSLDERDDWDHDRDDGAELECKTDGAASAVTALCTCGAGSLDVLRMLSEEELRPWGGGDTNEPVEPTKFRTIEI